MIGWACSGAEALHLLYEEGNECSLVLNGGLGHGIEVGLVGRAAALGNHHEAVLSTFGGLDVDLSGQVAAGVHLVVHVEWSVLRVAQIVLCKGVIHAERESLLVFESGPDLLPFFAVDDGGAGVLAEGQNAFAGHVGIAQELQCHVLVVLRSLGVVEHLCHLQIVLAAQHELHIVESLLCEQCESLW